MKLHELIAEAEMPETGYSGDKAGIVPFLSDGRCLFMVPSNAAYGGKDPSIAKGRIDGDETAKVAAVREGGEELGLRESNMAAEPFLGWSGTLRGMDATYKMDVYAVLVKNEEDFSAPDKETARTVWMTRGDFMNEGRAAQHTIMEKVYDKIDVYLKDK